MPKVKVEFFFHKHEFENELFMVIKGVLEIELRVKEDLAGRALMTISTQDKQLLLMKYQYNKSIHELQKEYKLSASAVKMRLLRARNKVVSVYSTIPFESS